MSLFDSMNETNRAYCLHHIKRSMFFLVCSFHSYIYIIKCVNYNLYKSMNYTVKNELYGFFTDLYLFLWILFTILSGVVHSVLACMGTTSPAASKAAAKCSFSPKSSLTKPPKSGSESESGVHCCVAAVQKCRSLKEWSNELDESGTNHSELCEWRWLTCALASTVTCIIQVICIYFSRQLHIAVIIDSNYSGVDMWLMPTQLVVVLLQV